MQIKISARHGHLTEEAQAFIREKAEKLLHFFDRLTQIEVTVDLKKEAYVVELLVSAEHKHDFVAKESHAELMTAVEQAVHKLEHQLKRYKEKVQDHRRRPSMGEVAGSASAHDAAGEE